MSQLLLIKIFVVVIYEKKVVTDSHTRYFLIFMDRFGIVLFRLLCEYARASKRSHGAFLFQISIPEEVYHSMDRRTTHGYSLRLTNMNPTPNISYQLQFIPVNILLCTFHLCTKYDN